MTRTVRCISAYVIKVEQEYGKKQSDTSHDQHGNFTVYHTALKAILVTVLFFGGICCVLFLNGSAQKKIKRLIASLLEMGMVLDLLLKNTALFAGPE